MSLNALIETSSIGMLRQHARIHALSIGFGCAVMNETPRRRNPWINWFQLYFKDDRIGGAERCSKTAHLHVRYAKLFAPIHVADHSFVRMCITNCLPRALLKWKCLWQHQFSLNQLSPKNDCIVFYSNEINLSQSNKNNNIWKCE